MSKKDNELAHEIERVAALADPVRRGLYLYVLGRREEVSRDQAAESLELSRALAAFHLDKLVDAGRLSVSFRTLSRRSGPGAGRPNKLYRASESPIELTLPARRYDLAARLLIRAAASGGPGATEALEREAEALGREIGREARGRGRGGAASSRIQRQAMETLRALGFEPRRAGHEVVLLNCPFDALRAESTLTCSMNLALCRGLIAGLEADGWSVRLAPRPGRCCVVLDEN